VKVVILAGGTGTRISEESHLRPKPMITIGGRPILWHIMKLYGHFGMTDFVICLGYKGYLIKEYFANFALHHGDVTFDLGAGTTEHHQPAPEPWRVTLCDTGDGTETGGRMLRIAHLLDPDEPFCLTYGDGVADVDLGRLVAFHRAQGREATLTAVRPPGRFGATVIDGDRVAHFAEKPLGDGGYINGGYFVLEPSVLDRIEGDHTLWEREPLETLAAEGQLAAHRHDGFFKPMDTLREKRELEVLWAAGNAPWKLWEP
jgi:glucose-1-phosphate cytidylyltransferase